MSVGFGLCRLGINDLADLDFIRHSLIFLELKQARADFGKFASIWLRFGSICLHFSSWLPALHARQLPTCLESIELKLFQCFCLHLFFIWDLKVLLAGSSKKFSFHFNHVLSPWLASSATVHLHCSLGVTCFFAAAAARRRVRTLLICTLLHIALLFYHTLHIVVCLLCLRFDSTTSQSSQMLSSPARSCSQTLPPQNYCTKLLV